MTELQAQTECQMALDAFGFIVVAIKNLVETEQVDRDGFIDEVVHQRGFPDMHLHAKLIGPATFEDWKRQNDLWGETNILGFYAFRKFVLE